MPLSIPPPTPGTRERILAAAQALFAEKGFAGTSLRMITSAAAVNLGAVNYHFVSKDALIAASLNCCMEPLNSKRLALLDQLEAAAGDAAVAVEDILEALFLPALEMVEEGGKNDAALRLMGMMFSEPGDYLRPLLREELSELSARFLSALGKSLPALTEEDLHWCVHFSVGAFVHTVSHSHVLELSSDGLCTLDNPNETMERLVGFCGAGLRALVARRLEQDGKNRGVPEPSAG